MIVTDLALVSNWNKSDLRIFCEPLAHVDFFSFETFSQFNHHLVYVMDKYIK